jgi:hypothetical protein
LLKENYKNKLLYLKYYHFFNLKKNKFLFLLKLKFDEKYLFEIVQESANNKIEA